MAKGPLRLLVAASARPDLTAALDRAFPAVPWAYYEGSSPGEWGSVEALLVGSFARDFQNFDASATPRLRFVQGIFTGLDGLPFGRIPEHVQIAGNIGAFAPYVAEHAVAIALAAARDLRTSESMVREGRLRPAPQQRPLFGAIALILGYGAIGREVGDRVRGFGAHVHGLNRDGAAAPGCERMFARDHLHEAVADAAIVFEVRPLTRLTAGSIGAAELAAMRPDAIFVNVGRAGTVDEEALYRHLKAHLSFRAAIDVWWTEDFASGTVSNRFPFAELPNVVGTPHSAGFAPGAEEHSAQMAIDNVARFFRDGQPLHVVDRGEYAD